MMAADIEMNDRFQVFVRIVSGRQYRTFTLTVSRNDRINDVAAQLAHKTSVPRSQIMLSYQSRQLSSKRSLSDYNIERDSTLSATVRGGHSDGLVDHGNACFPVSINNEQLMNEINSVDQRTMELKRNFKRRISQIGIDDMQQFWDTIGAEFNHRYRQLNVEKIKLYEDIIENHDRQKVTVGFETQTIRNEIAEINTMINKGDREITRLKAQIEELKAENIKHFQKRGAKQSDLQHRLTSIESIHAERHQTDMIINDLRAKMEDSEFDALRPEFEEALRECEKDIDEWSTDNVMEWIRIIEGGKYRDEQRYQKLFDAIKRLEIDGESFPDLRNESCLKLCGLNKEEIKTIFKHIDRVLQREVNGQKNLCTVCVVRKINTCFIPCGHQSACWECYNGQKRQFANCPICRKAVTNTVRTFMNGF